MSIITITDQSNRDILIHYDVMLHRLLHQESYCSNESLNWTQSNQLKFNDFETGGGGGSIGKVHLLDKALEPSWHCKI